MEKVDHVVDIADKDRIVQSELFPLHRKCLCRRLIAQDDRCRITRRKVKDKEHNKRDADNNRNQH